MLTIFTPTFNRKNFLSRAYDALCQQTCADFIWLIIDDGSTDGTASLIESWKIEQRIKIEYHYQTNSGKMRAHNRAVELTQTELFTCIDSDDYLVPDAVETVLNLWQQLKNDSMTAKLAGVVAYRGQSASQTMQGEQFPDFQLSSLENLYRHDFKGETTLIYRTDILRQYPFPVIDGEKFIPEATAYDKIDLNYQLYVLPKVLTICQYQPTGLTNSIKKLKMQNPHGFLLYYQTKIEITPPSVLRYKYIAHAICFAWYINKNLFKNIPASKFEIVCGIPAALLLRVVGKL